MRVREVLVLRVLLSRGLGLRRVLACKQVLRLRLRVLHVLQGARGL